mgnify:CR=1 FL=1
MYSRFTLSMICFTLSSACVEVLVVDDLGPDASITNPNGINPNGIDPIPSESGFDFGMNPEPTPDIDNDSTSQVDAQLNDMMLSDMMLSDMMLNDMMLNDMMLNDMMLMVDQGVPEICDGQDNDLDGQIDENLVNACGQCPADVGEEMCDGQDNDCDQMIDEEAVCPCPTLIEQDSLYLFCATEVAWGTAFDTCAQHGFSLTSIQSAQENQTLFGQMQMSGFSDTWIGLNDLNQEGSFEWSDQSPMTYTQWGDGEPNDGRRNGEDCGIILMENRQSNWDDRPCSHQYSYICERPLMQP